MASEGSVYLPYGSLLSQGDIIEELPWGVIDSPLTICRPDNAKRTSGPSRYNEASSVKDAFEKSHDGKEYIHARAGRGPGIVLWHDCEIDKESRRKEPEKAMVGVAPIFCLEDRISKEHRPAIQSRQRSALFPLEPLDVDGFHFGEAYVDFRLIWSVKQSVLKRRLATLNQTVLHSLYEHLILFLTRRTPISPIDRIQYLKSDED